MIQRAKSAPSSHKSKPSAKKVSLIQRINGRSYIIRLHESRTERIVKLMR